jgi:spermidine/putrescine-binding protein
LKFLAFFASPEPEAEFFKLMPYGGPNKKAYDLVDPAVLADLPTAPANVKNLVPIDYGFWADNMDSLTSRFNIWAGQWRCRSLRRGRGSPQRRSRAASANHQRSGGLSPP